MTCALPRIIAVYQRETDTENGGRREAARPSVEFDVTDRLLNVPVKRLLSLQDKSVESGSLADGLAEAARWVGPSSVTVRQSLDAFLLALVEVTGVARVEELTDEHLAQAAESLRRVAVTDIEHDGDTYWFRVARLFDVRARRIEGALEVAVYSAEGVGDPIAECVAWDEDAHVEHGAEVG